MALAEVALAEPTAEPAEEPPSDERVAEPAEEPPSDEMAQAAMARPPTMESVLTVLTVRLE